MPIEMNPRILKGKPVIKGTRIPVHLVLQLLAEGMTVEDILKEYPELKEEDVKDAIRYASKVMSREELYEIALG